VETDGAATHLTPTAFEEDRRRDAALQIAGYRVVRFTWAQVTDDPRGVAATLRALL
jgi:very-short-patch-repair endonuclease